MDQLYSNGPRKDFLSRPYQLLLHKSSQARIVSPYVTRTKEIVEAAKDGKSIQLIVGLNVITTPEALEAVHELASCEIRYFTRRFHAKFYLFDDNALLGSSNLTDGGLELNREATLIVDEEACLDEIRALFDELWKDAQVLTSEKLSAYRKKFDQVARGRADVDQWIEDAVGRSEPMNVNVASLKKTAKGSFYESLRRQVEQYRKAFNEVTILLEQNGFWRAELKELAPPNETNRFLNWVRLTYAPEDNDLQGAPIRSIQDRKILILGLGAEWAKTPDSKIPSDYVEMLRRVQAIFGARETIEAASKEQLSEGLMSLHAFSERRRFVSKGELVSAFWEANNQNVKRAKQTLAYLVHERGDFVERLHHVVYDAAMKLSGFGKSCSLELYGTIKPAECPAVNGRIAKGLRYLGFDVRSP